MLNENNLVIHLVKISVIIPALNEEHYILGTLKALQKQSFKDFEVIVADGGSKDKTREIAKKYAKVIIERKKGMGAGRNAGAKVAKGEIIVFLDADTFPSKDLLKTYSSAFDSEIIAATGPILPLEKVSKRVGWGYEIVSVFFVKLTIMMGQPSIVGSNFAVKRKIFDKVGGFDEKLLTYEDWDLSSKLKKFGKIAYCDDAKVKTSARRVLAWGVSGYFLYHVTNMVRYYTIKKPQTSYPEIR
jgi:glycosyltransferase involved in cell wall biosynthesis